MKYLIVGAGAFGASTALYLKKTHPDAEVVIVDRTPYPCPSAAGHDLNKIIRAEYNDLLYMGLAAEAMAIWKSDPVFSPFFHETGIVYAATLEPALDLVEKYISVAGSSPVTLLEPSETKEKFNGIFRESNFMNVTSCIWNPTAGWADAEEALRSVIQAAIALGVTYEVHTVSKVLFDDLGESIGVETTTGEKLEAGSTILCTGASTAVLLADSAPDRPEVQVQDRMVASAAAMCLFGVPEPEMAKYSSAPIIVNPMGEMAAESIPPGSKKLCKCTHELSFTNYSFHEASRQRISVPPKLVSEQTWSQDMPPQLKEETHKIAQIVYGSWVKGLKPVTYRMCWDAVTPNQDWIICPHPAVPRLYVATGGSFHGWKFLANIGKYVTQMLDGTLDETKATRWAWDRTNEGGANVMYLPSRDLADIRGSAIPSG